MKRLAGDLFLADFRGFRRLYFTLKPENRMQ